MRRVFKNSFLLRSALLFALASQYAETAAQSLPVGMPVLEEHYRRSQLLQRNDSAVSFMIRPLSSSLFENSEDPFFPDTNERSRSFLRVPPPKKPIWDAFKVLPLSVVQQYDSHHPYAWNDGAMIPAAGYQMMVTSGIYFRKGGFSVQLKPELVFAQNREFEGFPTEHHQIVWAAYYDHYYNRIDQPERFGKGAYNQFRPGQSSIRWSNDVVSAGISSENLWWGPGVRNSLLMSNTAPGFLHFTVNTPKAVHTPAGAFEGQIVSGWLENSGFTPPEINRVYAGIPLYYAKNNDWRYFSGITINYQPKWIPGLYLGFGRTLQMYGDDIETATDFLPLLLPFKKFKAYSLEQQKRDQHYALYARWVFPEAKGEVYAEYGRTNHAYTNEGYPGSTDQSRAYVVGLRKLVPVGRTGRDHLQVNLEVTQLQNGADRLSRPGESWYTSSTVRHGYTHQGQIIGAGIGPGSNLQSLDISWVRGMKRIGLQLERLDHNDDFYYAAFSYILDWRSHWVDLTANLSADWNYRNLLFNARIGSTRSMNYQWWLRQYGDDYFVPGRDVFNFHGQLGMTYRF